MENSERILMLLEDAELLQKGLAEERPNIANVRALAGPILRKWLLDGQINQVNKQMRPDHLSVFYLSNPESEWNAQKGLYSIWVGNFSFNGVCGEMTAGTTPAAERKLKPSKGAREISGKISKFLSQPVCVIFGRVYSRKEIIRFHANNLGGAHYDPREVENTPAKKRLRDTIGYEVTADGRNIQMRMGPSIIAAKQDPSRRHSIYDLADLVLLDAAHRFSASVLSARDQLHDLL